jgi:flagellar FliL protein
MLTDAMTQPAVSTGTKRRLPLLAGGLGALVLGAAGFYLAYAGMIPPPEDIGLGKGHDTHAAAEFAFVPIEPMVLSLGPAAENRHLRFTAELEVVPEARAEVTMLLPRVRDVLNGYLRAVEVSEIESPSALVRLRAHMLRRVQIVTGENKVRDLLISEFVLN